MRFFDEKLRQALNLTENEYAELDDSDGFGPRVVFQADPDEDLQGVDVKIVRDDGADNWLIDGITLEGDIPLAKLEAVVDCFGIRCDRIKEQVKRSAQYEINRLEKYGAPYSLQYGDEARYLRQSGTLGPRTLELIAKQEDIISGKDPSAYRRLLIREFEKLIPKYVEPPLEDDE